MTAPVDRLLKDGKALILAYDQGFEHGPTDFDQKNVDPSYIVNIANEAGVFTGIVFQKGVAQKYYPIGGVDKANFPPLILKLNGKTAFHKGEEPYSPPLATVDEAIGLGACAVGYTIYVGSEHEAAMMKEFADIERQAHTKDLAVVAWMYPRGKHVEGVETSKEVIAYAARLGLELGADMIKLPYTGDPESFSWVVSCAGKAKVVVQGGSKKTEQDLFSEIKGFMEAGAVGMAVGRNVWQSDNPLEMSVKIANIIYGNE